MGSDVRRRDSDGSLETKPELRPDSHRRLDILEAESNQLLSEGRSSRSVSHGHYTVPENSGQIVELGASQNTSCSAITDKLPRISLLTLLASQCGSNSASPSASPKRSLSM